MKQTFSAVLDSKKQVKNMTLSDDPNQKVFFEADIGQLEHVCCTEGQLLEVIGTKGVLRIDLPLETIRKLVDEKD
jgi:hypothetical protein